VGEAWKRNSCALLVPGQRSRIDSRDRSPGPGGRSPGHDGRCGRHGGGRPRLAHAVLNPRTARVLVVVVAAESPKEVAEAALRRTLPLRSRSEEEAVVVVVVEADPEAAAVEAAAAWTDRTHCGHRTDRVLVVRPIHARARAHVHARDGARAMACSSTVADVVVVVVATRSRRMTGGCRTVGAAVVAAVAPETVESVAAVVAAVRGRTRRVAIANGPRSSRRPSRHCGCCCDNGACRWAENREDPQTRPA